MILSRITPPLLFAVISVSAGAQPVSAERAMRNYRSTFKPTKELDCPRPTGDEIVVCGRGKDEADPNRLPIPVEREAGARIAGEGLTDGGGCIRLCHQPLMIDLIATSRKVAEGLKRVIEGDD